MNGRNIAIFWIVCLTLLVLWTIWNFYFARDFQKCVHFLPSRDGIWSHTHNKRWAVFKWAFFFRFRTRRNAEAWERNRQLRWLRAKSIELGLYNPDNNFLEQMKMLFASEGQRATHSAPQTPKKAKSKAVKAD